MEDIDIPLIKEKSKWQFLNRKPVVIILNFCYYFIKTYYSLLKVATLGLINVVTVFFTYPFIIGKSLRFSKFVNGTNTSVWLLYSLYTNPRDAIRRSFLGLSNAVVAWLLNLAFIVPSVLFKLKYFLLPYVIADNPTLSNDQCKQLCAILVKGRKLESLELLFPFIFWYMLNILSLGLLGYFYYHYLECSKANYYNALKEQDKTLTIQKTSMV